MERKHKYIQFPLLMIRELFTKRIEIINNIIRYGIYKYSTKLEYDLENVARQLMYGFYNKRIDLSHDLEAAIERYISEGKLTVDEKTEYEHHGEKKTSGKGFIKGNFNPFDEMCDLQEIFKQDTDFLNQSIEYYQMSQSYKSLEVSGNPAYTLEAGKEIDNTIPDHEPFPMINNNLLFDFRDTNKTESDIAQFAAYIAIRSILGKKPYCKTNKKMIVARMFGYASPKHLPDKHNCCIFVL